MLTLLAVFGASVLHEVLCVAYLISVTDRRMFLASILSGVIAGANVTILIGIIVSDMKIPAIVVCVVAHSLGAFWTTKLMPRKERQ